MQTVLRKRHSGVRASNVKAGYHKQVKY